MNSWKVIAALSLLISGLVSTYTFAEAPAAPSLIGPNDHVALAHYYEGSAKEISVRLETYKQKLKEYEEDPYYYGRQGQDLHSHLRANIREYENDLADDLKEANLHREIAASEQDKQSNTAEANIAGIAVQ